MFIPQEIQIIANKLKKENLEVFLVGGCVRDLLLGREPKDWDIATNAKPEEIQKIFPDSVYENKFGTVAVKVVDPGSKSGMTKGGDVVEITTYRKEGKYTDKRHPDEIKFAKTIEEDLARRDFTVNAMALPSSVILSRAKRSEESNTRSFVGTQDDVVVDPFDGQKDLKEKIIRTVGKPEERFNEDALRLMRAVRLAAELGFKIEEKTAAAIKKHAGLLEMVAKERIRDELTKLIMAGAAANGVQLLTDLGLMKFIIPELLEGIGIGQNKHHIYTVFEHNLRALDYSVRKNYSLIVRLASLLHDVGKPRTKRGEGYNSTFYNHEVVGGRMALKILDRLRFSKEIIEKASHLVHCHLFYYNVGDVSEAGVRRFLRKVGPENVEDVLRVREADRIGSGVPKAFPYKLRHLLFMIEKVKKDPINAKMLKVKGDDVMKIAKLGQEPKVGKILAVLLEDVLDDPAKNVKKYLESRIKELNELPEKKLGEMVKKARERKEEFESGVESEIKQKFYVK